MTFPNFRVPLTEVLTPLQQLETFLSPSSGGNFPAYVINGNASPYSMIPNSSGYDNSAGLELALADAVAYALAHDHVGVVYLDPGEYYFTRALQTVETGPSGTGTTRYYAQVRLPFVPNTSPPVYLLIATKSSLGSSQPFIVQQRGSVVFRSSLTGASYSGTYGWPSMIGGPDEIHGFNDITKMTWLTLHLQGVGFRQPQNPSLACLNHALVNRSILEDLRFDVVNTNLSGTEGLHPAEPTHPTGVANLCPSAGLDGVYTEGSIEVYGYYGGFSISELSARGTITIYRSKIGLFLRTPHALAQLDYLYTFRCMYDVACLDPTASADTAGVLQVETATVVGAVGASGAGFAQVVVTAANMLHSPKTLNVAVTNSDSASTVAGKMRTALAADSDVSEYFTVSGASAQIILTRRAMAANDATLNVSIANGTCTGLTAAPTSSNTTAGVAVTVNGLATASGQGPIPISALKIDTFISEESLSPGIAGLEQGFWNQHVASFYDPDNAIGAVVFYERHVAGGGALPIPLFKVHGKYIQTMNIADRLDPDTFLYDSFNQDENTNLHGTSLDYNIAGHVWGTISGAGDFEIVNNMAVSASTGVVAQMRVLSDGGSENADYIVIRSLFAPLNSVTGFDCGIILHYIDDNNYLLAEVNGSFVVFLERKGGVTTSIDQVAQSCVPRLLINELHEFRVEIYKKEVHIFLDGIQHISATISAAAVAAGIQDATGYGLFVDGDNPVAFDFFKVQSKIGY